jgi:hypothetical protein
MENKSKDNPLFSETSYRILKKAEPRLSAEEKRVMWTDIERRTTGKKRSVAHLRNLYVAASIALVLITVSIVVDQNSFTNFPYNRRSALVDIDTLRNTRLYFGDQQIELGEQVEIYCLPSSNQLEIKTAGNSSFKLSVPQDKEMYMQLAVPKNKRAQIVLADNSKIILREQSKFIFPFHQERQTRGKTGREAYMQIAPNKHKRFITQTNYMDISVLGTEFLVVAYPHSGEQSVLLVKGSVQVTPEKGESVIMVPNQKFIYNKTTASAHVAENVNVLPAFAWKENLLIMDSQSLAEVLKTIEAHYGIAFSYNWKEMESIHISGKLDISVSLNEVLENISRIAQVTITKEQRTIKITKEKP